MNETFDILVQFMAQLYKVGVRIEQVEIKDKMIIKFSIPQSSFLYNKNDLLASQQALIEEVQESLLKIFTTLPFKLMLLYRIRTDNFLEKDSIEAEQTVVNDFKDSNFLNIFQQFSARKNQA